MAVQKLKLTEKTESKLGDEGVRQVAAHLWARDCQTCGGALGGQPPALYVIDMHTYAFAELHHEECRAPDWNDSGLVTGQPSSVANLSHEALSVVLPFNRGGQADLRPSLLVNPGLELVQLELDDQDQWQVVLGLGGRRSLLQDLAPQTPVRSQGEHAPPGSRAGHFLRPIGETGRLTSDTAHLSGVRMWKPVTACQGNLDAPVLALRQGNPDRLERSWSGTTTPDTNSPTTTAD